MNSVELLQVQVYFRHGCRTPLHHVKSNTVPEAFWDPKITDDLPHTLYPYQLVDMCTSEAIDYDPKKSYATYKLPGGALTGQLIQIGQQEAFDLGQRLKQIYVDKHGFVSRTFDPSETFLRSTYLARTINSLRCVLAGLFGESCKENGKTETAIISTLPLEQEFLFPNPKSRGLKGKLFSEGVEEYLKSEKHNQMKSILRKELGVDILTDDMDPRDSKVDCPIWFVRDDYIARQRAGYPIPEKLTLLMPEISKLSVEEMIWELLGKKEEWYENISLVIDKIYPLILCNIKNRDKLPKFHLYSCHDSIIALILYSLDIFDGDWPPFAADIIFELYRWKTGPSSSQFKSINPVYVRKGHGLSMTHTIESAPNHKSIPNWSEEDMRKLWFRILYMGKPLQLSCLWNLETPKDYDTTSCLYPLALLVGKLVSHMTRAMTNQLIQSH